MYKRERVNGYEKYEVDTDGVVYGQRGNPLKYSLNPKGYCMVIFSIGGKTKGFGIHQIVARQFVFNSDPEHKTQVNHIDGNKTNNRVDNLEWVTPKENSRHSVDILGNMTEDRNWRARAVCGVDVKTHVVKYYFASLISAARFFAQNELSARHIQTVIWKVLQNSKGRHSYRGCVWFYASDFPYKVGDIVEI